MAKYEDFQGKVVIITGARRGMGKSHALKFAENGAKVVVSDIQKEECEKVADEIKEKGGEVLAIKCDVSQKEEVEEMVKETIKNWGKIDVLVNNAGIADFKPFLEMTEEDWDKTININLKGYFLCAKACAKEMVKINQG